MKAELRELLRHNLLAQLEAVTPSSLRSPTLAIGAQSGGFNADEKLVEAELAYLAGKGLVAKAEKTLSPENKHWHITADGRDYVALHGL